MTTATKYEMVKVVEVISQVTTGTYRHGQTAYVLRLEGGEIREYLDTHPGHHVPPRRIKR